MLLAGRDNGEDWKLNGWNRFRIRSIGAVPHLATRINGEKIAELDAARLRPSGWDPKVMLQKVGRTGHIALAVHSNGPTDALGQDRWAPGAVCLWRNILVKPLWWSLSTTGMMVPYHFATRQCTMRSLRSHEPAQQRNP